MLTSEFDYNLPSEFIAQTPADPRDSSRLMVVNRENNTIEHKRFSDLLDYIKPGDLVVWNDSKVFKARLIGKLMLDERADGLKNNPKSTDKIMNAPEVEIFLVRPTENNRVWKALAKPGRKLRLGMKVRFAEDFEAEILLKEADGTVLAQFEDDDAVVRVKANRYGFVPTPPYIGEQKMDSKELETKYQTVYAVNEGSVAAPTAGFHFTPRIIEELQRKGVEFAEVTLHVGLGTFMPVKTEQVEDHKMHEEWVELSEKNAEKILRAKRESRRVIAIGTTSVRALEGIALKLGQLASYSGDINIFITPGFKFKVVDALVTNFHLPKSTLLMLVAAFMKNKNFTLKCYEEAKKENYRFYSFGDAMFIY